eukprot:CAMPEP_0116021584 /NCGR_PEP_ID=MMETSP0321-20121206/10480_1 /TAXON_ID=163516 /ORGANISM="Leptocylindrus danicus var. danicus, Strain B650" /LENGTH=184 /DNA_ID=CAMNT_0003492495 /DNA_START=200 /DNA_END=754 /DNA_ORIENTATION=+
MTDESSSAQDHINIKEKHADLARQEEGFSTGDVVQHDQKRKSVLSHDQLVILMVVLWIVTFSSVSFAPINIDTVQAVVGIVVNLNLVFFYGGPLSTIVTVMKTQNSISIHRRTLFMNTANATFWTAYAISIVDYYIMIPNGLGVLLGIVQVFLVIIFPRIPFDEPKSEDEQAVELPKAHATDTE